MADKTGGKGAGVHERRYVPAGTIIISEGESGRSAFLIQSGTVSVSVKDPDLDQSVNLTTLGAGQIFGEMALITDVKRTATVTALSDCNLIMITRDQLAKKVKNSDPTVRALVPMLMKRLTNTNEALVQKKSSLSDMTSIVTAIYDNISASLIPSKSKTLENKVKPQMTAFLAAVENFQKLYDDQ